MRKYLLISLFAILLILASCTNNDVIRIGFVGTLSGSNSEIGVAMRDGLLLKVDELNAQGGINGKAIELVIEDDKNDHEMIKAINQKLIDDGIKIIFGHELSSKTTPLMEVIKDQDVIVMSPTLSTYEISGLDDNFFRTIASNYDQGKTLGDYAKDINTHTLMIYSEANAKFAKGVNEGYTDSFSGTVGSYSVQGSVNEHEDAIVAMYKDNDFDSVMFVMNPSDVMYLSQVFYKHNLDVDIYSSNWGMAVNALDEGGKAIEGATFVSFMGNLDSVNYTLFKEAYITKYQKEPEFAGVYSYEAATLLFLALEKSEKVEYEEIKSNLLSLGSQMGLVSELKLDAYGDVKRELFLAIVEEGKLKILE